MTIMANFPDTPLPQDMPLPIDDVLPQIAQVLSTGNRLVLAAPPGAGKTTRVPLSLMNAAWATGRIYLLEPRRIAARLAATRMAAALGEPLGQTIGLATRIDRKVSDATRIEVITDGLFARRILADPELSGVCAILFDEFHERSLNIDLGLALAQDTQGALREDLRLVVMSATLDVSTIASKLRAPVIETLGKAFPVETIYVGRDQSPLPIRMAGTIRRALREQDGSLLCFLPGQGEIRRTMEALRDLPDDTDIAPLYGALSPREQDLAVAPAHHGRRKIVLATDLAESSLTIRGVRVVIDGGYARHGEYDPAAGTSRLVTVRVSAASADQRRGRAGRTEPGVCYRLWGEAETKGLMPAIEPEILKQDLSGLALSLLEWGVSDSDKLAWITPPPKGRFASALQDLSELGAIDATGGLSALGRAIAKAPLSPRLAAFIATAPASDKRLAAHIALLISERGLGGTSVDLTERLKRLVQDKSDRARRLLRQADSWTAPLGGTRTNGIDPDQAGTVLAQGWPMRIARRTNVKEDVVYQLANGRRAFLDIANPLANHEWLVVGDLAGIAAKARITLAAPISQEDAMTSLSVETVTLARYDRDLNSVIARKKKRLGAITLSESALPKPDEESIRAALCDAIAAYGLDLLANAHAIRAVQNRLAFLHGLIGGWPCLDDATLIARQDDWLAPYLTTPSAFTSVPAASLRAAMLTLIDFDQARRLDRLAPTTVALPNGRKAAIDYGADGGPKSEGRAQEFYGLTTHPMIADGAAALSIVLLSPAMRPIATTTDLPGFWAGAYKDMAKDMRGRYPKHNWPDNPATSQPRKR